MRSTSFPPCVMDSNCLLATIYERFGIDTSRNFLDHRGRPLPILPQEGADQGIGVAPLHLEVLGVFVSAVELWDPADRFESVSAFPTGRGLNRDQEGFWEDTTEDVWMRSKRKVLSHRPW